MQKILILKLVLFSSYLFYGQTDTNKINTNCYNFFYYDNGKISSEGYMKEGKPEGFWKNYYINGIIKNEGNRKNHLLDSTWNFYNEKGSLIKMINYKIGKKNGLAFTFDTAGKLINKDQYENDLREGISYIYYNSGKLHFYVPYISGKIDGEVLEFSEDSVLISVTVYKSGFIDKSEKFNRKDEFGKKQGRWKEFDEKGNLKKEITYRDGEIDGYIKEYDLKGNLINIEKFFSGKKIENSKELKEIKFYKEHYPNRKNKFEGGFVDGFPQGFHYYYNESGEIDSVLFYEDGFLMEKGKVDSMKSKVDQWIEFYQSGQIRGTGKYSNGKKFGDWKYQYPSGKTEQIGKYDINGNPTGEWEWYYENGNLLREENYIDGKRIGLFTDYFEDGKVIERGEYAADLKEGYWSYQMGNYIEKGNYLQGEKDSVWNAWWTTTGKQRYKGNWIQGAAEGKHTWWLENGKKMMEGKFIGGEKNGNWNFYSEEGELFLTITFENDEEIAFNGVKIFAEYEKERKILDTLKTKAKSNREQQ